jgi:hypothetical protein
MTCRSSFKLLKIFRYRHVIPTGPTGFLIAEFERKNIFNNLTFFTAQMALLRFNNSSIFYQTFWVCLER